MMVKKISSALIKCAPLDEYLAGRNLDEGDNLHAFNSMFIVVVKSLVKMVSNFKVTGSHFTIDLENLFWMGSSEWWYTVKKAVV